MEIVDLAIEATESEPDPDPIEDALQALPGTGSVTVRVETDTGVTGVGEVGFGRIEGGPAALRRLVDRELAPVVRGRTPELVRGIRRDLYAEVEYHGSKGLAAFGIAAIDTALWDCLGKARDVPCWQLWGGVEERIPAYAMVGWSNYDDDRLREVCARAAEQGFRGVKIKVGSGSLERDRDRIEAAREAIEPGMDLMVDANQALTAKEAIRRERAFADLGVRWFEEPIPADDLDGYARLAARSTVPVAAGENCYAAGDVARFLRRDAVDILQPDRRRIGGPTGLLEVAALADAFDRPYASHGGDPAHLNVLACTPTVEYLETGLLADDSPIELEDGCVAVPRGAGFEWT
jgi:L-alanine-DL-glutamate epimerase-like enolase superfamily enzyme